MDQFLSHLLDSFGRRFPNGFKNVFPLNALTLLNPCYGDLFFSEEDVRNIIESLLMEKMYDDMAIEPIMSVPVSSALNSNSKLKASDTQETGNPRNHNFRLYT